MIYWVKSLWKIQLYGSYSFPSIDVIYDIFKEIANIDNQI